MGRTVKTSYTDSWQAGNAGGSPANTYAYPTKLTDPSGNFSQVKYRYDIGANVWAKSPTIVGNAAISGMETTREFDTIGRPIKETLVNTGAYSRYEYLANQINSKVYTTITDADNNGIINTADEVLSESLSDGAGRTRMSRTELPNSTGGFSGNLVEYDILGQVKRTTVPTEIGTDWLPAGDDATRGFLWTSQEFDWKGRVTKEINTDNTFKTITYNGCGCAGGQVTTIEGEDVDISPQTEKRQTQMIYQDILGRDFKSETYNDDGSISSTTRILFDGRDKPIQTRKYLGYYGNPRYQQNTLSYDGFGRLKTVHTPKQDAGTFTSYEYHADNQVASITDARGVKTNYTYNNRGLLETISYLEPVSNPSQQPPILFNTGASYEYDAVGNRTKMTDSLGYVNYQYDEVSRLKNETRHFQNQYPLPDGDYTIQYQYELSGQLKSVTDPYGLVFTSQYDKLGRATKLDGPRGGTGQYRPNGDYISDVKYRAWGAMKEMRIRNTSRDIYPLENSFTLETLSYDDRLRVNRYRLEWENATAGNNHPRVTDRSYTFRNDGKLSDSTPTPNVYDNPGLPHTYNYNKLGRQSSETIGWALNLSSSVASENDVWGNITSSHVVSTFNDPIDKTKIYNFYNNRETSWQYDSDGRVTNDTERKYLYNYSGGMAGIIKPDDSASTFHTVDGNGLIIKRAAFEGGGVTEVFYIRSTVLGNVVLTEVKSNGSRKRTFVYGFGRTLAELEVEGYGNSAAYKTTQKYVDPYNETKTRRQDDFDEGFIELDSKNSIAYEFDQPEPVPFPGSPYSLIFIAQGSHGSIYTSSCFVDGFLMDCGTLRSPNASSTFESLPHRNSREDNNRISPNGRYPIEVELVRISERAKGIEDRDDELEAILRRIREQRKAEPIEITSTTVSTTIPIRQLEVYKTPCDILLGNIFGDKNSWAAGSGTDTISSKTGELRQTVRMADVLPWDKTWGHTRGYSLHLYAQSSTQTIGNANGNVFVPNGFSYNAPFTSDGRTFYYPKLDVTLLVMHIDPDKVQSNLNKGITNGASSIFIGNTTFGGGNPNQGYVHSHIEIHKGPRIPNAPAKFKGDRDAENTRLRYSSKIAIDKFFCGDY